MNTEIEVIEKKCAELGLNDIQKQTLYNFYNDVRRHQKDMFITDLSEKTSKKEVIDDFIFPYNVRKFHISIREEIGKGKYSVINVTGYYSYSVGISATTSLDAEIVTGMDINCGNVIIAAVKEILIKHPNAVGIHELDCVKPGRINIMCVNDVSGFIEKHFPKIDQWLDKYPKAIYLVHLSDRNNKLPGEKGYDESLVQIQPM